MLSTDCYACTNYARSPAFGEEVEPFLHCLWKCYDLGCVRDVPWVKPNMASALSNQNMAAS